jgi:PAS domain S-box-containing protein
VGRALLQEKISKSEQKYRTIFEKAPWCIILANPSGRVLDINPAGQELLETAGSGPNRSSILDLFPDAKSSFQLLLQSMDSFEIKELHLEGEQDRSMVLHMRGIPLVNEREELEGGMIIAEDITDAKRLQSQIIHQDKMATIGLLGAGVAHELNNIIAGMMGYAQLVLKRKSDDSLAKVVVEQCRRAHDVVDRLLNFSRRKDTPRKPVQAEELLEDVFQLVSREIERIGIRIVRDFAPDTPTILAQPGQIQQVFLNLVMNAMQAMKQDGILTVRTRHDREWLRVIFQDTGAGIPAKILPRIFEPFFTTKENHGTGLGLAVSYSIVQEYGGEITVESKENQGSTFTIHLPRQAS